MSFDADRTGSGIAYEDKSPAREDSKFLKIAVERMLVKSGFNVTTASDGEEALRAVRSLQPDIILLDMLLPKVQGLQVLLTLKKDPATARIPIIVLSSLSLKNEEKLKKAGAAAYFEKAKLIEHMNSGKLQSAIESAISEAKLLAPKTLAASSAR